REVAVWKRLDHPHVLPLLGLYTHGSYTYMVSPWMDNGDALSYVQKNPQVDSFKLLLQIAEGVEYLHTLHPLVIHGDLKGANIFISAAGDAYIGDFGLSQSATPAQIERSSGYSTEWRIAGNPRWQAPELIDPMVDDYYPPRTTKSDIFALSRTAYELFSGRIPFEEVRTSIQVMSMVMNGTFPLKPIDGATIARGFSDRLWELMKWGWRSQPRKRPSASQFLAELCAIQAGSQESFVP
ncbi:hypothetical protein BOTBODRAFT_121574, partial [Botryobasidium botryosum FD-172 SS1]